MSFEPEHELHTRRKGRNMSVGLLLAAFVAIVFAVTIVKLAEGGNANAPTVDTPAGAAQ